MFRIMTKIILILALCLVLPNPGALFAGGSTIGGGTIGKKLEILNYLGNLDTSAGGVFIADDKFIELIGVFGLKDIAALQNTGVTIDQLVVKDGVSGLQGYNSNTDYSFLIFSDSQRPLIKDLSALIKEMQKTQSDTFVFTKD